MMTPASGMIKVERPTKRFGQFVALLDISFEIKQGEIVDFLGPNGAGKTTAIKMLTTLLRPTNGRVRSGRLVASNGHDWAGMLAHKARGRTQGGRACPNR